MSTALKRSLTLPIVTLYGLGNILGAGIYVLVGKVAGAAGESTTLAFIVAMIIAAFTAFSYMELASRFPASASASVYLHKAFGKRWLSVAVGLAMVAGGITSAGTLALGFAGYLNNFITIPIWIGALGLLFVLGLVTLRGIGESAKAAAAFTLVEIAGLIAVVWFGRAALTPSATLDAFAIDPVLGLGGLVAGTFLAFYAFIGFEDMVNVAEETKNPTRVMPLAILLSLTISTVLYLLVVLVATHAVPTAELADSKAPLALVIERSGSNATNLLAVIGMAATLNGVIVQIIMGSRILYGLSKQGWITGVFAETNSKRQTPTKATLLIVAIMAIGVTTLPLVSLAQLTSYVVLSIFTLVNCALFVIKLRSPAAKGVTRVPIAVPLIGGVLCVATMLYQLLA